MGKGSPRHVHVVGDDRFDQRLLGEDRLEVRPLVLHDRPQVGEVHVVDRTRTATSVPRVLALGLLVLGGALLDSPRHLVLPPVLAVVVLQHPLE